MNLRVPLLFWSPQLLFLKRQALERISLQKHVLSFLPRTKWLVKNSFFQKTMRHDLKTKSALHSIQTKCLALWGQYLLHGRYFYSKLCCYSTHKMDVKLRVKKYNSQGSGKGSKNDSFWEKYQLSEKSNFLYQIEKWLNLTNISNLWKIKFFTNLKNDSFWRTPNLLKNQIFFTNQKTIFILKARSI